MPNYSLWKYFVERAIIYRKSTGKSKFITNATASEVDFETQWQTDRRDDALRGDICYLSICLIILFAVWAEIKLDLMNVSNAVSFDARLIPFGNVYQ